MAAEAAAPFVGAERDGRGYFASTGEGSIAWRRTLILKRTSHFCVHLHNKEATCNTLHHLDYRATALSSQWEQFDRPPSSVPPYPSSSSTKCLREAAHKDSLSNRPSMRQAATVLQAPLHHSCLPTALCHFYKAYYLRASPSILRQIIPKSLGARTCTFFSISALLPCSIAHLDLCCPPDQRSRPATSPCLDETVLLSAVCGLVPENFYPKNLVEEKNTSSIPHC